MPLALKVSELPQKSKFVFEPVYIDYEQGSLFYVPFSIYLFGISLHAHIGAVGVLGLIPSGTL